MKKHTLARILSLTLILTAFLSLSGCVGTTAKAIDLMAEVEANAANAGTELTSDGTGAVAGFAVKLFQKSVVPEKNTLISPFSVLCALAMTANGAKGETLTQMEDVFGLNIPELNSCLHAYLENLPSGDKYKINNANSIWFKDNKSQKVEKSFLQTNANYYGASVYRAAFDETTLKDINNWVSSNTDGMIKDILDKIPDRAVMYLINALAFDAEWEDIYREDQVWDETFTAESGNTRDVELMYSTVGKYLDDGSATGFLRYYADRKYAFAALLPNEGIHVADYVASLTGDRLMSTLRNVQDVKVETAIPKFESEYSIEMSDILKSMGMTDAFDADSADFTGLGQSEEGNIFINQVIHKTYIAVDEKGTKAGAATAVAMAAGGVAPRDNIKIVHLDRPFVYMLIDCETNLPLFIGTVMK